MRTAQVVLREALYSFDKLYTYRVPEALESTLSVGYRVLVPFGNGNRRQEAYVISIREEDKQPFILKEIEACLDRYPIFRPDQINLAALMLRRYACTWGDALRLMLPATIQVRARYRVFLTEEGSAALSELEASAIQNLERLAVLRTLSEARNKSLMLEGLEKKTGASVEAIQALVAEGLLRLDEKVDSGMKQQRRRSVYLPDRESIGAILDSNQVSSVNHLRVLELLLEYGEVSVSDVLSACGVSPAVLTTLVKKGWLAYSSLPPEEEEEDFEEEGEPDFILTDGQLSSLASLRESLIRCLETNTAALAPQDRHLHEALLYGITGSGKTEVYLRLTREALKHNAGVILLVPEIALTPQMTRLFQARFGKKVAVLHSRLTPRQRYEQWRRLTTGEAQIAVGARSAIFAPVSNLGLILIDEEQESSYLAETHPRYDARTLARFRAHDTGALLVLGSATPSVEAFYRTQTGKSRLLRLGSRPGVAKPPEVHIVDMRREERDGNRGLYSRTLLRACKTVLEQKRQGIILLNRRGFAGTYLCRNCGYSFPCPHCSVNLTYHAHGKRLICHYCGHTMRIPYTCPECGSEHLRPLGVGTQQAEEELQKAFPEASILRMDQDTTAARLSHSEILDSFRNHEADFLIGTQMVAKGHDFPAVTLVGILAAERSLFPGNFRSAERAFQLFTQAAGRAGRGEDPGTVYLQTYNPGEYAIRYALEQNYEGFYNEEIKFRSICQYPPFTRLLILTVSAEEEKTVEWFFELLARDLEQRFPPATDTLRGGLTYFPAGRAPLYFLNKRYYWQMLIKSRDQLPLLHIMGFVAKLKVQKGIRVSWQLDPG